MTSANQGFRVVGADRVHRGYAFEVQVVTVEAPSGERFTRDVVRHCGAVAVLPIHDDGTVTLVRQYRAPLDAHLYEIPAGLRDRAGEEPVVTARRELAEEVGLAADRIAPLTRFHNAAGLSDEEVIVFVAYGLHPIPDAREGPEEAAMTVHRLPLQEVTEMVRAGAITDAKTVIAVLAHQAK